MARAEAAKTEVGPLQMADFTQPPMHQLQQHKVGPRRDLKTWHQFAAKHFELAVVQCVLG